MPARPSPGAPSPVAHPSKAARTAAGKALRRVVPLEAHAELAPELPDRDPVTALEEQATTRVPELVPIRYGRMSASPFAFYRGAALVMARDLGTGPRTALRAQLCGDAHMSNFGLFGTAERRLHFDVNDFDETLQGPFEWDVKRLAASIEIAGRANGFGGKTRRRMVEVCARTYRETMRTFAGQTNLQVWYASMDADGLISIASGLGERGVRRTRAAIEKAMSRDSLAAYAKLTVGDGDHPRIKSEPPLLVPAEDLMTPEEAAQIEGMMRKLMRSYRRSLPTDRRHLLEMYEYQHIARKVVGVGSVGTRAWVILLRGTTNADPLFLQAKEAQRSVLEEVAGASPYTNSGQRVVAGQRLMQAASDIFLGWDKVTGFDGVTRDFYVRQLRDWKGSVDPNLMVAEGMEVYGRVCAWTLARAHARSGDRVAIASYLGAKPTFDKAIVEFATSYADRNDADHAALVGAIASGRIVAETGV